MIVVQTSGQNAKSMLSFPARWAVMLSGYVPGQLSQCHAEQSLSRRKFPLSFSVYLINLVTRCHISSFCRGWSRILRRGSVNLEWVSTYDFYILKNLPIEVVKAGITFTNRGLSSWIKSTYTCHEPTGIITLDYSCVHCCEVLNKLHRHFAINGGFCITVCRAYWTVFLRE